MHSHTHERVHTHAYRQDTHMHKYTRACLEEEAAVTVHAPREWTAMRTHARTLACVYTHTDYCKHVRMHGYTATGCISQKYDPDMRHRSTYTHARTRIHARTITRRHTRMHARKHAPTCPCTHIPMHTPTHNRTHTPMLARTYPCTAACTHTYSHTHARTHMRSHARMHAHMHAQSHTQSHTQSYT